MAGIAVFFTMAVFYAITVLFINFIILPASNRHDKSFEINPRQEATQLEEKPNLPVKEKQKPMMYEWDSITSELEELIGRADTELIIKMPKDLAKRALEDKASHFFVSNNQLMAGRYTEAVMLLNKMYKAKSIKIRSDIVNRVS